MRPVLKANKSMDDIHGTKTPVLTDRRTRSQSPVKNRRSLPPNFLDLKLPSLQYATPDDLKSLTSNSSGSSSGNSSISIDQIRKLSKSPVSKRLHINTTGENGQYVIPIPFTLSLPPKLSPKNKQVSQKARSRSPSPTRHSKSSQRSPKVRSKLVYTGNGYEKLDTLSSDTDSEVDTSINSSKAMALPPRPSSREILSPPDSPLSPKKFGPPSVNTNKRKSVKSAIQARQLKSDELSIIEELSSNASSRASSLKEKKESTAEISLPPTVNEVSCPPSPEASYPSTLAPPRTPVRSGIEMVNSSKKRVPPPVKSPQALKTLKSLRTPNKDKDLPPIVEKISGGIPRITTEGDIYGLKASSSNFSPTKNQFLQIHKRSFSDESHVSSVSSFSSVGDVLSFASRRTNLYNISAKTRNVSNNSTESIESSDSTESQESIGSWDSVQKSIDLTIHESNSSFEEEQDKDDILLNRNEADLLVHDVPLHTPAVVVSAEEVDKSIIADYYMNDTTEQATPEPVESQNYSSVSDESQETIEFDYQGTKETDNEGLGKQFNFPNNFNNITNDEATKRRIISSESHKSSRSRFSYYSNRDGQIEIPDFSEASFSEMGSMRKSVLSVHGTTFNDLASDEDTEILEPIGIPSSKGKRIVTLEFKHLYEGSETETDSDIENEPVEGSLYSSNLKSVSTPNIANAKKFNDLPPLPVSQNKETLTPMRHTRNKSHHSRTRSLGNIQFCLEDLLASKPENEVIDAANEDQTRENKDLLEEAEEAVMNIPVAAPPSKVNYQVDFKDNTAKENQLTRTSTPTMNELKKMKPPSVKYASSNSSSSYQSSRSDKYSNSTGISDVESVVIDLTEEKYDVCMIQRNNSTQSYKSVTEVHKGKEVEVVLVDEEDEQDLESIYSKYGKNWLGRSNSTRSDMSSTSSTFSYNSMASESQIRVKNSLRDRGVRPTTSLKSNASSKYNSRRIKLPPKISEEKSANNTSTADITDNNYFDYTKSSSYYDFNTFINQKV